MVDKTFLKKQTSSQKGQAIFELIIFLPFLIFLYSIFYTAGNSISGSINQQKAVRGYFYALTKGNSYINTQSDLLALNEKSLKSIGFSAVGWREKSSGQGDNGFAPCFEFTSVLKNGSNEGCDDKTRDEEGKSKIIRVFTFYGVCGPVYGDFADTPSKFFEIKPELQNNPALCSLDTSPPS